MQVEKKILPSEVIIFMWNGEILKAQFSPFVCTCVCVRDGSKN